ncbi:MAG: ATP-dependent RNA helicase DbpA [Hahellaceae bacterium]|nr:ATP-dependent RNA helicase DbpA [Hahellaceae bacterium]MCP5211386.1 ATP-dependent RNA helicase DbpA [Hahellaceae bacterium]
MSDTAFNSLPLAPEVLRNLESLGYHEMTAIQAQSLPITLQGQDLIGKAKTGSGKTAAFGLPLITKLNPRCFGVQSLVLCPTRELSAQVADEIRRLARQLPNIKVLSICGGQPIGPQIGSLEHGAHVVVGTPGRIKDHLRKGTLKIDQVETFVLDEADRMLDMGFIDDIITISEQLPNNRQTLLFSATFPEDIRKLSERFQRNPSIVEVESTHAPLQISQQFYRVDKDQKDQALIRLLAHHKPAHAVIFCNTKQVCNDVADMLRNEQYLVLPLQGDMEQRDRDQTLVRFSNRSISLLVATDVAARGIDIDDLDAVINYDLPWDPEVYIHRIGRTGRAGNKGAAFSLCAEGEQARHELINSMQEQNIGITDINSLPQHARSTPEKPAMVTLSIDGGKKDKIRPTDILGALTGAIGLNGNDVGKITIFPFVTYVAVNRSVAKTALAGLQDGKIKGRKFQVRRF